VSGRAALPADRGEGGVISLYAEVLASASFEAAAQRLVRALCPLARAASASLAWVEDGRITLLAASHQAAGPAHEAPPAEPMLLGALEEAIDQGVSTRHPLPGGELPGPSLQTPVDLQLRALHRETGGALAVLPLGDGGEPLAAVCLQRDGDAFTDAELQALEDALALAVPALRWMRDSQLSSLRRLRRELGRGWQRLRQPDRKAARRLLGAGAALLVFLAAAPLEREVSGRARIEGAEQRVLAAPVDGFVKQAHARPGDRVQAGATLVELLEGDLQLEQERWASQLAQHENAYAAAMAKAERSAAATSLARLSEAQAQLDLVTEQLARSRIAAPFDGVVIDGDLSQAIGKPVRQGETLLTLATAGRQRVIVQIDEVDIARVRPGQPGRLALSSLPWDRHDVVVERILPLARAVEGRNVFEVEARLLAPRADVRPGLLGRAELVVGRLPPLWAWLGHVLDRGRVAWWAWLG
jgi:biotin carboxyl carrier protein